MAMSHEEALSVLAKHRGDRIVITTMTAVGMWPALSDTPLDFAYMPSAMGHGPALGLGLALAQPERGVIVLNGDGSTLMSLGSMVTLANHPADVYLIIMDMARSAGIQRVYTFEDAASWSQGAAAALSGKGPVAIWLKLQGRLGQKTPKPPRAMSEQIARLRQAIGVE
jgi:sulfopyruvate decarboxylase subunit beta